MKLTKKYFIYLLRWQLSTPILAVVMSVMTNMNKWSASIIANLIGGLVFFWVDMLIFKKSYKEPLWEIKENVECIDCHNIGEGYRIVLWGKYDRSNVSNPEYRCKTCSQKKMNKIKKDKKNNIK